ncbi:hypothetical protein AYI70_g1235 [Smittium culicis]|uniref:Uncharacterized protein n=1 Tax=Smittium culicis TaxID=133412 RepID=A0A1R1YDJ7_9FUNG|nr:hypothetical protein AYI70_g1235 [Smittium culicis]
MTNPLSSILKVDTGTKWLFPKKLLLLLSESGLIGDNVYFVVAICNRFIVLSKSLLDDEEFKMVSTNFTETEYFFSQF